MGSPPFPRAIARAIGIAAVAAGLAASAEGNGRWPRAIPLASTGDRGSYGGAPAGLNRDAAAHNRGGGFGGGGGRRR
jgi:hypothetical protein